MKSLPQLLLTMAFAALFFSPTFVSAAELRSEYQINDHGQNRTFVIATDELQVIGKRHPDKILTAPSAEAARQQAIALGRALGKEVQLVLYPRGGARSEFSRRILTREVLVHLEPGENAEALARANGATLTGAPDYLANHFLFSASEPGGTLQLAEALR